MRDTVAVLHITKWEPANGWSDNVTHVRNSLIKLLREATSMTHTESKRFVRQLLDRSVMEFSVRATGPYNAIRHNLEVLGAEVRVELAPQQGTQADGLRPPLS